MNIFKIYALLFILFLSGNLFAEVRIFLFPEAGSRREGITVEDLGKIEGSLETIESLRRVPIEKSLYRDGFIGRNELHGFLRGITGETVLIYGNGIRISGEKGETEKVKKDEEPVIKSGDAVKLAIIRKGIRIEVECEAAGGGSQGDTINVKLKNNRTMKGIIINKRLVETRL